MTRHGLKEPSRIATFYASYFRDLGVVYPSCRDASAMLNEVEQRVSLITLPPLAMHPSETRRSMRILANL